MITSGLQRGLLVVAFALFAWGSHAMADTSGLRQLRSEAKFTQTMWYVGPDTPEDGLALTALVNGTIDDVLSLPRPIDGTQIRQRLRKLVDDVDLYATEDREQAYRYVIRIWRAAGFAQESELFEISDEAILRDP
jgi:hypothetical protein